MSLSIFDDAFDQLDSMAEDYINLLQRLFTITRLSQADIFDLHDSIVLAKQNYTFATSFDVYSFLLGLLVDKRPIHYLSWSCGMSIQDLNHFSILANQKLSQ